MKLLGCALLLLAVLGSSLAHKSYAGYKVLRTAPVTHEVQEALHKMESDPRFDFWSRAHLGHPAVIMASPENVGALHDSLQALGLAPTTFINDVGPTLEKERADMEAAKIANKRSPRAAVYDRYMEFDEIMAFQHEVAAANPNIVSIVDLATSTEGRPVHALKISNGPGKNSVWLDCGFHAREWAGPPMCLNAIEQVVASSDLQAMADWYILPIANPDGYSYTHSNDRFWRKTRRANSGSSCVGTDPNRNFDFLWNENNNNNFCAEDYPGNVAFSEPECLGVGNFVRTIGQSGECAIYLTMHSYGALMLYPYGHTNEPVPNQAELQAAGDEAATIIEAFRGTRYDVGPSGASLYYTWGASDDFAYGVGNIPYSYTFELPGGGSGGFNPPASSIVRVVEETWPGVLYLVERALAAAAAK